MSVTTRPAKALLAVAAMVAAMLVAAVTDAGTAAAASNPAPVAGARKNATTLTFAISGTAQLSVDVGTGNAMLSDRLLTLPGVFSDLPVGLVYNSSMYQLSSGPSSVTGAAGSGWSITGFDQRLVANSDSSVTYFGVGGLTGVFTSTGSGSYSSPAQFQATLSGSSTSGWTLVDHTSQDKLTFSTAGRLTGETDRNGNSTTYSYSGSAPSSIVTSRGPAAGRTMSVGLTSGRITSLSQTSGALTRAVSLGYSANGNLASVTDAAGKVMSFASDPGTDTGHLVTITSPLGKTTTLGFDSSNRVIAVVQQNPSGDGGAGTSTTRLSYPSATQTLVADPTTNQSQAISAVPHSTYTLDSSAHLVTTAVDPDGNSQSASYNSLNNVSSTTAASGGQATYGYATNNESLTGASSPGGASSSISYANSGASAFSPSSSTDDAGTTLDFGYDANGNQTSTSQTTTSGSTAAVTYRTASGGDGTPATSASPGAAAGVVTSYGEDTNHDLNAITPPSGNTLGGRAYTYDGFGRLATSSNGRGDTITYTYDKDDRVTLVHNSNGNTGDVSYTYDDNGRITKRIDALGTTAYAYDDLGKMTSAANSYAATTTNYSYDLDGDLASMTTPMGTTSYGYDNAHLLTSMSYPQGGSTSTTLFGNDTDGHRTDAWLQSNANHTTWAAHEHYTYDTSGRVKTVLGEDGPATSPTTQINQTLCYAAGATAPSCPTTTSTDRSNVQWSSDTVTGETTTYTYTTGRLTTVAISGGTNPRSFAYGYDNAGNRTSASVTGTSPTSQSLTYNNVNQINSSGYTYDASGNMTAWPGHTATYNAAGQETSTTQGGVTTYYKYAADNEHELMRQSTSGSHTYNYTYGRTGSNGEPELVSMQDGSATGYVLDDPSGQPILLQTSTAITCLYLYDGIGNPIALSASNSTTNLALRYDPYGAATRTDGLGVTGASALNPFEFKGGVQDRVTGEIKFGQRWYNPDTGTWTQQDTLNTPLNPTNGNRYEYAGNDPINNTDPTGMDFGHCIAAGLLLAGGGATLDLAGVLTLGTGAAVELDAPFTAAELGVAAAGGFVGGALIVKRAIKEASKC